MSELTVDPAGAGLHGVVRVPGDKSLSHRAVLLAALAEGRSTLRGLSAGEDVAHTVGAMEAFGAGMTRLGRHEVAVEGGVERLHEPGAVLDVGNSGTGIRLLAGWAAARPGLCVLQGDASIAGRPMARVLAPLAAMGARVDGRRDGTLPPLVIRGGGLHGIDHTPEVASAQVKGAILLAALGADGPTTVREAIPTRQHSEELLVAFGARIEQPEPGVVTLHAGDLDATDVDVPADPSQAAFWVVAATVVPGSDLLLPRVYVGPGRAAFLDVLIRMGADIERTDEDPVARTADLRVRAASLEATTVSGDEVPGLIDEIPVLAVAAAHASGTTTFADAGELRHKESDRVQTTVAMLEALGGAAEPRPDGLVVTGKAMRGGRVRSAGDHRIAMAGAVAALGASGSVTIEGWASVATSYPGFEEDLRTCVS